MFLCDKCHDAKGHMLLFRSRGQCEMCGQVADCLDCHRTECKPPEPKEPR